MRTSARARWRALLTRTRSMYMHMHLPFVLSFGTPSLRFAYLQNDRARARVFIKKKPSDLETHRNECIFRSIFFSRFLLPLSVSLIPPILFSERTIRVINSQLLTSRGRKDSCTSSSSSHACTTSLSLSSQNPATLFADISGSSRSSRSTRFPDDILALFGKPSSHQSLLVIPAASSSTSSRHTRENEAQAISRNTATRAAATSKRADGTRARGRRDDRRMHRCTPVRPLPPLYPLSLEGACCSVPFRGGASMRSSRERAGVCSPYVCLSLSFFAQLRDRDYAGTKTEAATTTRQWRQSFSVSAADSTSGLESHVVTPLSAVVPLPRSP